MLILLSYIADIVVLKDFIM